MKPKATLDMPFAIAYIGTSFYGEGTIMWIFTDIADWFDEQKR
jgi:hypothetical protein